MPRILLPAHARDDLEIACQEILHDPDRVERGSESTARELLASARAMIVRELGEVAVPPTLRRISKASCTKLIRTLGWPTALSPEHAATVLAQHAGVAFARRTEIALPVTAKPAFEAAVRSALDAPPATLAEIVRRIVTALGEATSAPTTTAAAHLFARVSPARMLRLEDRLVAFASRTWSDGSGRAGTRFRIDPAVAAQVLAEVAGLFELTWTGEVDVAQLDVASAAPYVPARRYEVAELLAHPVYGVGVVREVAPTKICVVFASGTRVLVHART